VERAHAVDHVVKGVGGVGDVPAGLVVAGFNAGLDFVD